MVFRIDHWINTQTPTVTKHLPVNTCKGQTECMGQCPSPETELYNGYGLGGRLYFI